MTVKILGHENAILGITTLPGGTTPIIVYDENKIIENLMADDMSFADAKEYFEFNILAICAGEQTPIFVERFLIEDIEEMDFNKDD